MFFSESFSNTLKLLSEKVSRKIAHGTTNQKYLLLSIQAWCENLNIPDQVFGYIWDGYCKQGLSRYIDILFQEWDTASDPEKSSWMGSLLSTSFQEPPKSVNPDIRSFISEIRNNFGLQKTKIKFSLLIAFLIVCVGQTLYFIRAKYSQNIQTSRDTTDSKSFQNQTSITRETLEYYLILVLNAKNTELINALQNQSAISSGMADRLYDATQELWMGSKIEFWSSPLRKYFDGEKEENINPDSEYDIYFVRLELSEYDSGFEKHVDQLKRIDAFSRLPDKVKKNSISVSTRLSSKAYENVGVYSR